MLASGPRKKKEIMSVEGKLGNGNGKVVNYGTIIIIIIIVGLVFMVRQRSRGRGRSGRFVLSSKLSTKHVIPSRAVANLSVFDDFRLFFAALITAFVVPHWQCFEI
jgi:hypothetical protein